MSQWKSGSWRPCAGAFGAIMAMAMMALPLLVLLPAPADAAPGVVPVFALVMESSALHARVTEGSPGTVQFSGRMSIDTLPVERCVVTLVASMDTGWATQVSPLTAVFTSTRPQPFNCSVVVPQGTPHGRSGNLTVRGQAVAGGLMQLAETRGVVVVDPIYRFDLSPGDPVRELQPGRQARFTVRLTNTGNAEDSYGLEIGTPGDPAAGEWTVAAGGVEISNVPPGESGLFRIGFQSFRDPTSWKSETASIMINATSRNAQDHRQVVSRTLHLTVHVKAEWNPSLSLSLLALSLAVNAAMLAVLLGREGTLGRPGMAGNGATGPGGMYPIDTPGGSKDLTNLFLYPRQPIDVRR